MQGGTLPLHPNLDEGIVLSGAVLTDLSAVPPPGDTGEISDQAAPTVVPSSGVVVSGGSVHQSLRAGAQNQQSGYSTSSVSGYVDEEEAEAHAGGRARSGVPSRASDRSQSRSDGRADHELDHLVPCMAMPDAVTGLIEVPPCTILAIGTGRHLDQAGGGPVSYTHLTLPTKA